MIIDNKVDPTKLTYCITNPIQLVETPPSLVFGMCTTKDPQLVFYGDWGKNSVKALQVRSGDVQRIYKSDWQVSNVLQIDEERLATLERKDEYSSVLT